MNAKIKATLRDMTKTGNNNRFVSYKAEIQECGQYIKRNPANEG